MIKKLALFISLIQTIFFSVSAEAKMTYLYQYDDVRQVALANDDGTMIRLLTSEAEQAYHPEISADGRYVSYSFGTIKPGEEVDVALHVMDLETDVVEVWTPKGNQYIHAEFSGNGEYLAYSGPAISDSGKKVQNIFLIHLPTERARGYVREEIRDGKIYRYFEPQVKQIESEYHCYFPAVASDASFVIYHRTLDPSDKSSPKELMQYDMFQKKSVLLTPENGHAMVPSLSADNRYVVYAGIQNEQWDIHLLDLFEESDRMITNSAQREFTPVFSPDGSVYYSHLIMGENFDIDLYKISWQQVFDPDAEVVPTPFINSPDVMEYVPAFSGNLEIAVQQDPQFPEPARSSFGGVAHNGKVYMAGGHQGPEHQYERDSFLDRMEVYDPATGSWTEAAAMSVPRHGFELIGHGNYIYAFGGFAYSEKYNPKWHSLDIIERYNIKENKWTLLSVRLPRPRSSNIAAKIGSKVYLIGGWDSTPQYDGDKGGRFHSKIDVFDLESLSVSVHDQEIKAPLRRALTGVVNGDNIYLLGGITEGASHFDWLDNVTVFNPKTNAWSEFNPLPFETFAPGAGIYNGELYFFGGMNKMTGYTNTIYSASVIGPSRWNNSGHYLNENKGFPIVVKHPRGGLGILGGHTYEFMDDGSIVDHPVSTFERLF